MWVLVLSLGLHWAVLQPVAWASMLITYAREATIAETLVKTFDGKHPCSLCLIIKKGRADQKKQEQQGAKPASKLDFGLVWESTPLVFAIGRAHFPAFDFFMTHLVDAPPKPRPRCPFADSLS